MNLAISKEDRRLRDSNWDVVDVPLNKIGDNPFQPRKKYPEKDIKALASNITERGLLQPVIVVKSGENYILVGGHRRFRAFKKLHRKTIPAVIRKESSSTDLALDLAIENALRKDFLPYEKAQSIFNVLCTISSVNNDVHLALSLIGSTKNAYSKRGFDGVKFNKGNNVSFNHQDLIRCKKLLNLLDVSENTCVKYLRMLLLPGTIQEKIRVVNSNEHADKRGIDEGHITSGMAYEISRVKGEHVQLGLYEKAIENKYDGLQLRAVVDELIETNKAECINELGSKGRNLKDHGLNDFIEKMNLFSSSVQNFRTNKMRVLPLSLDKMVCRAGLKRLKHVCEKLIESIDNTLDLDEDVWDYKDVMDESFEIILGKGKSIRESRFTFPAKTFDRLDLVHGDRLILNIEKIKRSTEVSK